MDIQSLKKRKIRKILKTHQSFSTINNSIIPISKNEIFQNSSGDSLRGCFQEIVKKSGRLYNFFVKIFSPVYFDPRIQKKIRSILDKYNDDKYIINLGSGPGSYQNRQDLINIDLYPFREVDIVADAADLPFNDNSVDLIINIAMLEHVPDPNKIIKESYRILKKGGKIIAYLPFMVPFHAAPGDYYRWTKSGLKLLFSSFSEIEIFIGGGPTSAMLWIFIEWLSLLFSFGSEKIYDLLFLFFMVITAPLKLFDYFLSRYSKADNIASGFYILAQK